MASVSACVCACMPYISNQDHSVLRASLMHVFRRTYGLPYNFHSTKGVIQYGQYLIPGPLFQFRINLGPDSKKFGRECPAVLRVP